MSGYKRNITQKINKLLEIFPAVVILGARQTGKTTIAKTLRPQWTYIDLERSSDYELMERDPEFFFQRHPDHVIIDEAQEYPAIFNLLRSVIDEKRAVNNRFIITGSSHPDLLKHVSESLAGRVALVELGTLTANELSQQPLSQFYQLFDNKLSKELLPNKTPPRTQAQTHQAWLKGGYPQPLSHNSDFEYQQWMENYQATYINRDIQRLFPKLNKIAYQRFLHILGKLSGTIINKANIAKTIEVSETTIKDYLSIADGTYLWRQLNSYEKNITKSIVKMPKGHIRDSGLLHYILKIHTIDDLYRDPIVGYSFESFVIENLIKGLQATTVTNWQSYYYRTRNGAEIDCILDGPFGCLPIEIKYGSTVNFKQLRALTDFVKEHNLPFGLLINQSEKPEWVSREIFQLPVGWI